MANQTLTNLWGTAQNITLSLASLATAGNAGRQSDIVSSTNYFDGLLHIKFTNSTGGVATTEGIKVYLTKGNTSNGLDLTDNATGTDSAITFSTPSNFIYVGMVNVIATVSNYNFHITSLAQVFGGNLPPYWSVVVQNQGGGNFTGTEAQFTKEWIPLIPTVG
jgi:hypothetical protein